MIQSGRGNPPPRPRKTKENLACFNYLTYKGDAMLRLNFLFLFRIYDNWICRSAGSFN